MRSLRSILPMLLVVLTPGLLHGSGYAIPEQGAKASGLAGAWVARADDAAANWYNPAALVWLDASELQFGVNVLFVGDMEFRQTGRVFPESVGGVPVAAGETVPATYGLEDSVETPGQLYFVHPLSDRLALGVGVNTPFGLISDWSDRPVTYSAKTSELLTLMVNPNLAIRLGRDWSVAVGIDYVRAELKTFSAELATLVPVFTPEGPVLVPVDLGERDLTADGDDLGWNAALHRRGDPWSFGLSYRSEIEPRLDGEVLFTNPALPDSAGSGELTLPARALIGIAWDRGGTWAGELDLEWTDWSAFDALRIDFANPFIPDIALRESWDDTIAYRVGVARRWTGGHEGRAGVVLDERPGPADTLRPAIPDTDRLGLTVGYGFRGPRWSVDGYYMALFFEETTAVPGEMGVIGGEYEGFGNVFGLSISRRF